MEKNLKHKNIIPVVEDLANPRQPFKLIYYKPSPYHHIELIKTLSNTIKMQK